MAIGNPNRIMSFGKFEGLPLCQVPLPYLCWMVTEGVAANKGMLGDVQAAILAQLDIVPEKPPPTPPPAMPLGLPRRPALLSPPHVVALVRAGRRTLTAQHHPDVGGATDQMQAVNVAADYLVALLAACGIQV